MQLLARYDKNSPTTRHHHQEDGRVHGKRPFSVSRLRCNGSVRFIIIAYVYINAIMAFRTGSRCLGTAWAWVYVFGIQAGEFERVFFRDNTPKQSQRFLFNRPRSRMGMIAGEINPSRQSRALAGAAVRFGQICDYYYFLCSNA